MSAAAATEAPKDTPPKAAGVKKGGARPGAGRPAGKASKATRDQLCAKLETALGGLGLTVSALNFRDGQIILEGTPQLAGALADLAQENEAVRRVIEAALQTSAWTGVLMALAPMVLAILANHGLLPGQLGQLAGAGDETLTETPPAPVPFPAPDAAASA